MTINNVIDRSEHVFIAGSTGTGKTVLAKAYLSKYQNVMILDTKGTFYFEPFLTSDDYVIVDDIQRLESMSKNFDKIVYRPKLNQLTEYYYDEFFKWCYLRGNTIVCVDEAMQVSISPQKIPYYYKGILTRGRELKTSVWSLTQRPSGLSQLILTESTHYFIFRLNHILDRDKISKISGQGDFKNIVSGHKFRYWRADKQYTVLGELKIKKSKLEAI